MILRTGRHELVTTVCSVLEQWERIPSNVKPVGFKVVS